MRKRNKSYPLEVYLCIFEWTRITCALTVSRYNFIIIQTEADTENEQCNRIFGYKEIQLKGCRYTF